MNRLMGFMTGSMVCYGIWLGDELGLYRVLAEDGPAEAAEPFALDDHRENLTANPMAALCYHASSAICTPNSLSQDVGAALGAQAGEARVREVFEKAGYTRFRRAAQTPLNLILEARP